MSTQCIDIEVYTIYTLEKYEKSLQIIWIIKKHAISLHPLSPLKTADSENWFLEIFLKKKLPKNLAVSKI